MIDSLEVPINEVWSGGQIAEAFEKTKAILVEQFESLSGSEPGFRFVDISDITYTDTGAKVYITSSVGSIPVTAEPEVFHSTFLWGGANTAPSPGCTALATTQIATIFNFQAGQNFVGNPFFPLNFGNFFNIKSASVTPTGGVIGPGSDIQYKNRDFPTGNTNAPSFPSQGEFAWHQDNNQDELCFSVLKIANYASDQLDEANGPILNDIRNLPGSIFNSFNQLIGEVLSSQEVSVFQNGQGIVDINAHNAAIFYGFQFIIAEPVPVHPVSL